MMSDFDGVEWLENQTKPLVVEKKEIAPPGVHSARIITAEKYKSQSGNWTVRVVYEINNGNNRDCAARFACVPTSFFLLFSSVSLSECFLKR